MIHALFETYAERYDLHTPPHHYQHDHMFVLDRVRALRPRPSMLDVGCGTGVLLEKALAHDIDAHGIDAAAGMVAVATRRVGQDRVRVAPMQAIDARTAFDAIVSLSWTLNYAADEADMREVLDRVRGALRPGGLLIAQVAHAAHTDGEWMEDQEPGPGGEGDVRLRYRFRAQRGGRLEATYEYTCRSLTETLRETHLLQVADARRVAELAHEVGLVDAVLLDSWRGEGFASSPSPFLLARAP